MLEIYHVPLIYSCSSDLIRMKFDMMQEQSHLIILIPLQSGNFVKQVTGGLLNAPNNLPLAGV